MAWLKRSSPLTVLALAVTLGLSMAATAQDILPLRSPSLSSMLPNKWELTPRPPGPENADNRKAGATRGPCTTNDRDLTALVPASGVGATFAEYPTVHWYMPEISTEDKPELDFVLKEQGSQQVIYSARYTLGKSEDGTLVDTPGIKSLAVPPFANIPPLEVDQEYQWEVTVICEPNNTSDRSGDLFVHGKIKRVQLDQDLILKLQQANLQERIALYADNRLWYETVSEIVELRRNRPYDRELAEAWNKLISSVDLLGKDASEPWFQVQETITNKSR